MNSTDIRKRLPHDVRLRVYFELMDGNEESARRDLIETFLRLLTDGQDLR